MRLSPLMGSGSMTNIVGMFWNHNEADIVEETLTEAIKHVDSLFVADDHSTDNSLAIIESFAAKNSKVEYVRSKRDNPNDKGQRQSLLTEIQRRYKPEDTWVQIIESDIMILDTDIREALNNWAQADVGMSWQTLNAARKANTWGEADTYPNWEKPIKEIMPYAHWMEVMLYTFRPLPKVHYDLDRWRPWPQGLGNYGFKEVKRRALDAPLLAHYGYRGPTQFYEKFKRLGKTGGFHPKYKKWDLRSVESVSRTVSFFNGHWNGDVFPMSREGWVAWRKG